MNNVLPLKTPDRQRRFTDEAQVQQRRNTPLPQEVGEPFDSKLFWIVFFVVMEMIGTIQVNIWEEEKRIDSLLKEIDRE